MLLRRVRGLSALPPALPLCAKLRGSCVRSSFEVSVEKTDT
jgi:hypothetical protein